MANGKLSSPTLPAGQVGFKINVAALHQSGSNNSAFLVTILVTIFPPNPDLPLHKN